MTTPATEGNKKSIDDGLPSGEGEREKQTRTAPMSAIAVFNDGSVQGTVTFVQKAQRTNAASSVAATRADETPLESTTVAFDLAGFPAHHAFACHVHEYGDLSNGCDSTGGHFNPYHQVHGSVWIDPVKRHAGDLLNNLIADAHGRVRLQYDDNLIVVQQVYGRSVVIHSGIDDLGQGRNPQSKVNGNAGGRMACAVIGIAQPPQQAQAPGAGMTMSTMEHGARSHHHGSSGSLPSHVSSCYQGPGGRDY